MFPMFARRGNQSWERAKSLTAHHVRNCRCPKSSPYHCHAFRQSWLKKGGNLIQDTRVTWASYVDISSQVRAVREVLLLSPGPTNLSSRLWGEQWIILISRSTCVPLKIAAIQIQDWLHKDHSIHHEMEIPFWKQARTFLKVLRSQFDSLNLSSLLLKKEEKRWFSPQDGIFLRVGYAAIIAVTVFCARFFYVLVTSPQLATQVKTQRHPEVAAIDLPLHVRDLAHFFLRFVA